MVKKLGFVTLVLVIAMGLSATAIFAANRQKNLAAINSGNGSVCVAQGAAGVCNSLAVGQNFVDEDNDGMCDNMGTRPGSGNGNQYGGAAGQNFVDENNDGVCDNMGTCLGNGTGNQYGGKMGLGNNMGYCGGTKASAGK